MLITTVNDTVYSYVTKLVGFSDVNLATVRVQTMYTSLNSRSKLEIQHSRKNGSIQMQWKINVGVKKSRHNASAWGSIRWPCSLRTGELGDGLVVFRSEKNGWWRRSTAYRSATFLQRPMSLLLSLTFSTVEKCKNRHQVPPLLQNCARVTRCLPPSSDGAVVLWYVQCIWKVIMDKIPYLWHCVST